MKRGNQAESVVLMMRTESGRTNGTIGKQEQISIKGVHMGCGTHLQLEPSGQKALQIQVEHFFYSFLGLSRFVKDLISQSLNPYKLKNEVIVPEWHVMFDGIILINLEICVSYSSLS